MDFIRFNFSHASAKSSYSSRDLRNQGENIDTDQLFEYPDIDSIKMNFLPSSFFNLLKSSYTFDDPYVAMSIVPEKFDNPSSVFLNLAAAGFVQTDSLDSLIEKHYDYLKCYLSEDSAESFSSDSFSFASLELPNVLEKFHQEHRLLILLFNTPVGFAIYGPSLKDLKKINADFDYGKINVGIVVSTKEILKCPLENFTIKIYTPSGNLAPASSQIKPLPFCTFSLVQGTWQANLDLDVVSRVFTYIFRNFNSARDNLTISFRLFSGSKYRVIGLIGRFSDIVSVLTSDSEISGSDKQSAQVLNEMKAKLNPCIFFFVTKKAVSYVILYIPDDFVPNHPYYKEVTEYAYTFMRRACTLTLLIPNTKGPPQDFKSFNQIQGLLDEISDTEILFLGSGESQIMTRCNLVYIESMEFNDLSDFVTWMNWVSPYYNFDFSQLSYNLDKDGISFDEITIMNLIENEQISRGNNRHFIDSILFGDFEHKTPEEIADMLLKSDEKYKDNDINKLFSEIEHISKLVIENKRPRCAVCHMKNYGNLDEEVRMREISDHELSELCPWCCLKKLQILNKADSPESKDYTGKKKIYEDRLKKINLDLNLFFEIIKNVKTSDEYAYIKINVLEEFCKWIFQYWCKLSLEVFWDELKEGNYLQLDHFDDVSKNDKSITDDMTQCIETLTKDNFYLDTVIKENLKNPIIEEIDPFLRKAIIICDLYGCQLDKNDIFDHFKEYLTEKVKHLIENVTPPPYQYLLDRHQERNSALKKFFNKKDPKKTYSNMRENPTIVFKSITETYRMSLKVDIINSDNYLDFKDYTFTYLNQLSDEKFSTKQLQCEKTAILMHQPYHIKIVNAWKVNIGTLVLIAIGTKARLIFLPTNFKGRFTNTYLYETDVADSDHCYAAFAPRPYSLFIVSDSKSSNQDSFIALLQVSIDFSSAVEIKRRPLDCLLPLPSFYDTLKISQQQQKLREEEEEEEDDNDYSSRKKKSKKSKKKKSKKHIKKPDIKVETSFVNFIVDDTAQYGALGASIVCGENGTKINFLMEFNPSKLSITKVHRLDYKNGPKFPVYPLYFCKLPLSKEEKEKQKDQKDKSLYDAIVCVSADSKSSEQYIFIYSEKSIDIHQINLMGIGDRISNKIGVASFRGQDTLIFAKENKPPQLQSIIPKLSSFHTMKDLFNIDFSAAFIPDFIADCYSKKGLGEIERVLFSTHIHYPLELVKFEILNSEKDEANFLSLNSRLFKEIKSSMKNVLPLKDGCSIPFRIYKNGGLTSSNEFNVSDVIQGKNNYDFIINFVDRILSLPQLFISSIRKVPDDSKNFLANSIISLSARYLLQFPPLPLLRGTHERQCMTVSLVDIGSESEGSSILSSIAGIPFSKLLPGCVNVGVNYVPILDPSKPKFEKDKFTINSKAVTSFYNTVFCHFKPDRPDEIASNFVALFCAMKCSDIVIVNAGNQTQFLIDVLKLFIEIAAGFNSNYWLFEKDNEEEGKNNDGDDDDNEERAETDDKIFDSLKGLAFVTKLGCDPLSKINEIEKKIIRALLYADNDVIDVFKNKLTFVPSEFSTFEIARSITNDQLLNNQNISNSLRGTIKAYKNLNRSCAGFGSLSSHLDYVLYTGNESDDEDQNNDDSDDDNEEEEKNDDDDDDE